MSATVSHFSADQLSSRHLVTNTCDITTTTMTAVITVQPPSRVQQKQTLYPSVVLCIPSHSIDHTIHYFATAVLLDSNGNIRERDLAGTTAVTGAYLASGDFAFAFTDLAISKEGTFTIRIDLYGIMYGENSGATLLVQAHTNKISVKSQDISPKRPSSAERAILREAVDAGLPVPTL